MASPYREAHDNLLGNVCNLSLCVLFLCLIMFRVHTLTELGDVGDVELLSPEQRKSFAVDPLVLTTVMLLTLGASVAVCIMLLIRQLRTESVRLLEESRTAQASRLRSVPLGELVDAPPLPAEDWYHLFLSHVWGAPQDQARAELRPPPLARAARLAIPARAWVGRPTSFACSPPRSHCSCATCLCATARPCVRSVLRCCAPSL